MNRPRKTLPERLCRAAIIALFIGLGVGCADKGDNGDDGGNAPTEPVGFVFRDQADAGNDPETPGCHYRWDFSRPPRCGPGEWHELHSGDRCKSDTELYEWVTRDCHEPGTPPDFQTIDCMDFCGGPCVVDVGVCPDPRGGPPGDSAHCECTDPKPPEL